MRLAIMRLPAGSLICRHQVAVVVTLCGSWRRPSVQRLQPMVGTVKSRRQVMVGMTLGSFAALFFAGGWVRVQSWRRPPAPVWEAASARSGSPVALLEAGRGGGR
jgi:hypothetical protein